MRRQINRTRETLLELVALRRNGYSGPFFNGLMMLGMGVWLLLPSETFATADKYEFMAELASESFWGALLVFTSLVMLMSALGRRPREVALGALVSAGMWLVMFGSFAAANPVSIAVPLVFVLFLRSVSLHQEFLHHFDPVTGEPLKHH